MAIDAAAASAPVLITEGREWLSQVITPDISADGRPDLVMLSGKRVIVRVNRGDGTFRPERVFRLRRTMPPAVGTNQLERLLAGDFNGDGLMDVAVGGRIVAPNHRDRYRTWLLAGKPGGGLRLVEALSYGDHLSSSDSVAIDIDHDGADEIVSRSMTYSEFDGREFHHRGDVPGGDWWSTDWWTPNPTPRYADVDSDGDTDILAFSWRRDGSPPYVLIRNSNSGAQFEPIPEIPFGAHVSLIDLTSDGLLDIVYSQWREGAGEPSVVVSALVQTGDGFNGPTVLYQETREQLRARPGRPPDLPVNDNTHTAYIGSVRPLILDGGARRGVQFALVSSETSGYYDSSNQVYGVTLVANEPASPGHLPTYTAAEVDPGTVQPSPQPTFGQIAAADFDGDGREDSVIARQYDRSPGYFGWVWSALYVELAADSRPVARAGGVSGDGPDYSVARGGLLTVNARFRPNTQTQAPIVEVNVFLDMNNNRRLDADDLRIGASTTADPQRPSLYRLQIRRRPAWNTAGPGPVAAFIVATDAAGRVSTPVSARLILS